MFTRFIDKKSPVFIEHEACIGTHQPSDNPEGFYIPSGTEVTLLGSVLDDSSFSGVMVIVSWNGTVFSIDAGMLTYLMK